MRRSKKHDILLFQGENINIAWAPNGKTIAVGNKEDLVTFIDVRSHKIQREEQFKFESMFPPFLFHFCSISKIFVPFSKMIDKITI